MGFNTCISCNYSGNDFKYDVRINDNHKTMFDRCPKCGSNNIINDELLIKGFFGDTGRKTENDCCDEIGIEEIEIDGGI